METTDSSKLDKVTDSYIIGSVASHFGGISSFNFTDDNTRKSARVVLYIKFTNCQKYIMM